MMDQGELRAALEYYPALGVFVWVKPSAYHREKAGTEAGCARANGGGKKYHVIKFQGGAHKRARLAWFYMTGRWPADQVDHINGNSLDDRWCNLREATPTQNAWNHKRRAKASELPMGVRTNPSGRFSARLAVNKRMIQIGTYDTSEQACAAYQQAREVYYGEFA